MSGAATSKVKLIPAHDFLKLSENGLNREKIYPTCSTSKSRFVIFV